MEKGRAVTVVSASACSQLAQGPNWWEKSLPYVTSENGERSLARGETETLLFFAVFFTYWDIFFLKWKLIKKCSETQQSKPCSDDLADLLNCY